MVLEYIISIKNDLNKAIDESDYHDLQSRLARIDCSPNLFVELTSPTSEENEKEEKETGDTGDVLEIYDWDEDELDVL
ncbi:hypothetical protein MBGDF03_01220 [Thermoplasmatales archaeon SCGC AB-540-F20]|nr:hypothetical protein MBGDF03_01220 [Thermoplasmatales archaeon SCGC AB-540-F20]